jgi:hypothetical protein
MVSVGHFHHWLTAAEEHKETENSFYSTHDGVKHHDGVRSRITNPFLALQ